MRHLPRSLAAAASLVGVAVGAALVSGASGPAAAAGCGAWSPAAEGRPSSRGLDGPGYLVWHDRRGWHLRSVTPAGERAAAFTGTITTRGRISRVRTPGRERRDTVRRARRSIAFELRTRGGDTDGIDFSVGCGAVAFTLEPAVRGARLGRGPAPASRFTATDPAVSGVQGQVVAKARCPVEGAPESDCEARPVSTTVDVYRAAGRGEPEPDPATPLQSAGTDAEGRFRFELPPGSYRLVARPVEPTASGGRPAVASVAEGVMTDVTLSADSGIR